MTLCVLRGTGLSLDLMTSCADVSHGDLPPHLATCAALLFLHTGSANKSTL